MNSSDTAGDIRPAPSAHWGFWATIIWSVALAAVFVVLQVAVMLVQALSLNNRLSETEFDTFMKLSGENGYILSVTTFVTAIVCCSLIVGITN